MAIPLFTSIPPNSNYQPIVENWHEAGFRVISVNSRAEAVLLRSGGIETIEAESDEKKLPISLIMDAIRKAGEPFAGFVNADCKFIVPIDGDAVIKSARKSIILMERIDVDQHGGPFNYICHGFDGFFFDTSVIANLKHSSFFKIGVPWWDYWFPYACQTAGHEIKKFSSPVLVHETHNANWDSDAWTSGANAFRAAFPDFPACDLDLGSMASTTFANLSKSPTVPILQPELSAILGAIPSLIRKIREQEQMVNEQRARLNSRAYRATEPIRWLASRVRRQSIPAAFHSIVAAMLVTAEIAMKVKPVVEVAVTMAPTTPFMDMLASSS
jgi:hypothetical protein